MIRGKRGDRWFRFFWFCLICFSTAVLPAESPKSFNGRWWASVSKSEQVGFVSGYIDCTDTELHGPDFLGAYVGFRNGVSNYYQHHPEAMDTSVGDVLVQIATKPPASSNAQDAENPSSPRKAETFSESEYFNGEYWAQADDDEELGFIEGYLWCHNHRPATGVGHFSKSPSEYRDLVGKWYGADPSNARLNAGISAVLYRYRDHALARPKPRP